MQHHAAQRKLAQLAARHPIDLGPGPARTFGKARVYSAALVSEFSSMTNFTLASLQRGPRDVAADAAYAVYIGAGCGWSALLTVRAMRKSNHFAASTTARSPRRHPWSGSAPSPLPTPRRTAGGAAHANAIF